MCSKEGGSTVDMLMIGDFGKDQDDEKALVMAVAMRRVGLIERLTVVANLGDSVMRARLAKGTVNALGAHDVRVGVGSDGGRPNEEIHEYEFMACPYLAPESELHPQGGHELAFRALEEAKAAGRQLAIVLNSAMTDMAAMLDDPRWEQLAPSVISSVVVMGGAREDADGRVRLDPTAANNTFDLPSATKMHERLQADPRIRFAIVTRHCASACQMPRCAFDGSLHPVALRLTAVAKPSLQKVPSARRPAPPSLAHSFHRAPHLVRSFGSEHIGRSKSASSAKMRCQCDVTPLGSGRRFSRTARQRRCSRPTTSGRTCAASTSTTASRPSSPRRSRTRRCLRCSSSRARAPPPRRSSSAAPRRTEARRDTRPRVRSSRRRLLPPAARCVLRARCCPSHPPASRRHG